MFKIISFTLGPVHTNTYLIADTEIKESAVIDPAWDGDFIQSEAENRGWEIKQIWLTHAHFDHIGGVGEVVAALPQPPSVALHPEDLTIWQAQGGAPAFGIQINTGPAPTLDLYHGQGLSVGEYRFEVRHAPGHTRGHVMFYCKEEKVLFCGDVIFQGSIGRTDLPGGDYKTLINSIQTQVLTLPDDTFIHSGHGPKTTVGKEKGWNPFLK